MLRIRQVHQIIQRFLVAAVVLGVGTTGAPGQTLPQPSLRSRLEHLEGAALHADVLNEDRVLRQVRRVEVEIERLRAARRYAEALPLQQRVLEIVERERGRDRLWTLGEVLQLAELYQDLGRYGEAEPLYQRMLEAHERLDGPVSPFTLMSFNKLAFLYQVQGRLLDAERIYRRALENCDQAYSSDDPHTLEFVSNLAANLISQGRIDDAEQYLSRALATVDRRSGLQLPETLSAATNLAVALQEQGRLSAAETLFRRVLTGWEIIHGLNSADTRAARANLTTVQERMRERGQVGSGISRPSAGGPTCMIFTDIVIIEGVEARMPKRMCRTPPSVRWLRD